MSVTDIMVITWILGANNQIHYALIVIQGGSNMTGTVYTCLHTNQSRSYLNHLVHAVYSDYAQRCQKYKLTYRIRSTYGVVVPLYTTRLGVQNLYALLTEPVYVFVLA